MSDSLSEKGSMDPKVTIVEVDPVEMEEGQTRRRNTTRFRAFRTLLRRTFIRDETHESPWPKLFRRFLYLFGVAMILAAITVIIYHSLLFYLAKAMSPLKLENNGLQQIVNSWVEPGSVTPAPASWLPGFSRDVQPKAIHSHNDYWRRVPLFEALSLGITGVEADCHLVNSELFVGHTNASLRPNRTFRSLYLDPLMSILENQNTPNGVASSSIISGVWDVDPSRGIVLMTDLKTEGFSTLEAVQAQLEPFRQKGWLTYWNGSAVVPGPITHIGTGNTPFAAILNSTYANSTYRDVFFDAPLHELSGNTYNASNSYYTSTSLTGILGGKSRIPPKGLSKHQMLTLKVQVDRATELGLVSRYWDIPTWPVSRRMTIWKQLEELGIGMLNADDIQEAARWNWRWCNLLGLELC